jgi:hypothetical protein
MLIRYYGTRYEDSDPPQTPDAVPTPSPTPSEPIEDAHLDASEEFHGLMSAADKAKLDAIVPRPPLGDDIHASAAKATPVDADEFVLSDSVAANVAKKITWLQFKAAAKTYFDTIYTSLTTLGEMIFGSAAKSTPVDADTFPLSDSAAANVSKKVTWLEMKGVLKTYFDTLYGSTVTYGTNVLAALQVAINAAMGLVRLDAAGKLPAVDGSQLTNLPGGTGDVVGPASSTADFFAQWNGTTGKLLKNGKAATTGGNASADNAKIVLFNTDGSITITDALYIYDPAGSPTNGWCKLQNNGMSFLNIGNSGFHGAFGWDSGNPPSADVFINLPNATGIVMLDTTNPLKAYLNFDGTTADNWTATYARTAGSTTVTITDFSHTYLVGHKIYCDFTSGTAVDGLYTIVSVIDANTYTITTAASTATSGNVTLLRRAIRRQSGIHSVTYPNTVGRAVVNLLAPLSTADYIVTGSCGVVGSTNPQLFAINSLAAPSTVCFDVHTANATPALTNMQHVHLQVLV